MTDCNSVCKKISVWLCGSGKKSTGIFSSPAAKGVGQPADAVDQAQLHRFLAVDDAAHVGGQLPGLRESNTILT